MTGRGSLGAALSIWVDVVVGIGLLVTPIRVAATGVPGGTLAGALLLFLGGYNYHRRRESGHIEPVAAALGCVIGLWLLAATLGVAPRRIVRQWVFYAGFLVVVANAAGYRSVSR